MRMRFVAAALGLALFAVACKETPTSPDPSFKVTAGTSVTFTGQGLLADGFGGFSLVTELCGVANGADVDGPYLLWVLTATGSTTASITFATGGSEDGTHAMTKFASGTFKYISAWLDPNTLTPNKVSATYNKAGNAQLTISHGCRPFLTQGAWCSPGFWGNAQAAAFALVGVDPTVQTFNVNIFTPYGSNGVNGFAGYGVDPSLYTVLHTTGGTYKQDAADYTFPNSLGTLLGANGFNATGAYLTSLILPNPVTGVVYGFDPNLVNTPETTYSCPIDHFGDYKP